MAKNYTLSPADYIKIALLKKLKITEQNYIAVPEVLINNTVISDIFVVNGTIHIYEIKSQKDSDKRLVRQISNYVKFVHRVTLVVHDSFLNKYSNCVNDITKQYNKIEILSYTESSNFRIIKPLTLDYDISKYSYLSYWKSKELTKFFKGIKSGFANDLRKYLLRLPSSILEKATIDMLKDKYKEEHKELSNNSFNLKKRVINQKVSLTTSITNYI